MPKGNDQAVLGFGDCSMKTEANIRNMYVRNSWGLNDEYTTNIVKDKADFCVLGKAMCS